MAQIDCSRSERFSNAAPRSGGYAAVRAFGLAGPRSPAANASRAEREGNEVH